MPELPEVETVARLIAPHVSGRTVTGVRVLWERTLGGASRSTFGRRVRGLRLAGVRRRAKYIVIDAARGGRPAGALVVHLRMTGRLYAVDAAERPGPYTRVVLQLDDGRALRFDDVRKFGRLTYAVDPDAALAHLGIEPLGDAFTAQWLARSLRARRRALKPLLLDQEFIAGLGNIYVDESLHRAGLHPLRRSDRVPRAKAHLLRDAIINVLREAVRREGSSFDAFYRTPEGQPGSYQHQFRVYGRDGSPCVTCGRTIRRIVVAQRGTHLCTRCQPAPRAPRVASGPRIVIRRATQHDAEAIGRLHTIGWQHAYRGQMPQDFLDAIDVEQRIERRRQAIREPLTPQHRHWVVMRENELLGFAVTGSARDKDLDHEAVGEVFAMYLQPHVIGRGLGRRLFRYCMTGLSRLGFRDMSLWVLRTNTRARRFYEAAGCTFDGTEKTIVIGGADVDGVRYRRTLAASSSAQAQSST